MKELPCAFSSSAPSSAAYNNQYIMTFKLSPAYLTYDLYMLVGSWCLSTSDVLCDGSVARSDFPILLDVKKTVFEAPKSEAAAGFGESW